MRPWCFSHPEPDIGQEKQACTQSTSIKKKCWERYHRNLQGSVSSAGRLDEAFTAHLLPIIYHLLSLSQRNVKPTARLFHAINTLLHFIDFLKQLALYTAIWDMNEGENTEELTLCTALQSAWLNPTGILVHRLDHWSTPTSFQLYDSIPSADLPCHHVREWYPMIPKDWKPIKLSHHGEVVLSLGSVLWIHVLFWK